MLCSAILALPHFTPGRERPILHRECESEREYIDRICQPQDRPPAVRLFHPLRSMQCIRNYAYQLTAVVVAKRTSRHTRSPTLSSLNDGDTWYLI